MNDPKLNLPKRPEEPQELKEDANDTQIGQGYNDARGEVPDKKDIPKKNGLNVRNDPAQAKPHPEQ
jgi:hypothetical protein